MRHRVYGRHFGRSKDQRTALFKSLVQSLFSSESIQTTSEKAKAIKGLVDKLINQAKTPTTRRLVSQFLSNKIIEEKLVKDIALRFKSRNSGYTSIVKLGRRQGDNADIVRISLVETASVKKESAPKIVETKKEDAKEKVVKAKAKK